MNEPPSWANCGVVWRCSFSWVRLPKRNGLLVVGPGSSFVPLMPLEVALQLRDSQHMFWGQLLSQWGLFRQQLGDIGEKESHHERWKSRRGTQNSRLHFLNLLKGRAVLLFFRGFRKSWMGGSLITQDWSFERAKCSSSPGCDEHWQRNFPGAFWLVGGSLLAECQNYLAYIFNTGLLMCGFVVTTNRAQGQVRQSNGHEKPPSPYFRSCPLHARFQESLTQSQWNVNRC